MPRGTELELQEPGGLAEAVREAVAAMLDESRPWEDRAALWQALHGWQLEVNRGLRKAKPAIVFAMDRGGIERAGRLRLKWRAKEVEWRCNLPESWTDADVQDALTGLLADALGRYFVRVIPAHLELDTAYLGAAMMSPSSVAPAKVGPEALQEYARALFDEAKRRGWRVEVQPEPTIEVLPARK